MCRSLFDNTSSKTAYMSEIHLHYDGWLTLPEGVRQKLGLGTGDRLEVELADGGVLLRPARRAGAPERAAPEAAIAEERPVEASAPALTPAVEPAAPTKRGPGRPRKVPVAAVTPAAPKTRGRRKSAPAAEAQAH